MTTGELLELLRSGGHRISASHLYFLLQAGHVERPRMNGSRMYIWEPANVGQVQRYFATPRRRGPKPQTEKDLVKS